jgi:hypothetical protein
MNEAEAQEWMRRLDAQESRLHLAGEVSPEHARTQAQQAVFDAKRAEMALQKRQKALQAIAIHRMRQEVQSHPDGTGTGVMSLLVKDMGGRAGYSNIDNRSTAILAQFHAKFAQVMDQYRTKAAGLIQDKEGLRNMVREIFGGASGDENARAAAHVWGEVAEMARKRFNRAGGAIPKREDWGMPQYHDPVRVKGTTKRAWVDEITPMLDRQKMRNPDGTPMSDLELVTMLDHAYDTISTDGLVDLMPGRMGGSKLANRRQDHRVLNFKDADTWLAYHDKYGHADIYSTLTDHLHGMASDIAKLEVMGPNPEASFRYMRDLSEKAGTPALSLRMLDSVWNVVSGKVNATGSVRLADTMRSVRNLLVSSKLGGAFLSAISDVAFLRQTSQFNGLPAVKVARRQLALMNPRKGADRLQAVRMNLTADAWVTKALAANRFTEVTGSNFSARMADFTMRASWLSAWTDAGQKAFGMEFQAMVADQVGKTFGRLPTEVKSTFTRYGINREDWDVLRQTDLFDHEGAKFFSPENLMAREDLSEKARTNLATKFNEMILTERDFAVPMPDARIRAITTGGAPTGTMTGELMRSMFMFKSFPITVIATHLYRGALQSGAKNKAAYLASMVASTTAMGAVAMQLKEISRGKDPRDLTESKAWAAAFVQGGGAGIYGDFLFSDVNRFGKTLLDTTAGPLLSMALEDIPRLTLGNVQEFIRGDDTNLAGDLVQFARGYTPGGSLWYARLAFEREVLDQLQLMADPKARSKFRRRMSKRRKDYGQEYWWRPGGTAPKRAPKISASIGEK